MVRDDDENLIGSVFPPQNNSSQMCVESKKKRRIFELAYFINYILFFLSLSVSFYILRASTYLSSRVYSLGCGIWMFTSKWLLWLRRRCLTWFNQSTIYSLEFLMAWFGLFGMDGSLFLGSKKEARDVRLDIWYIIVHRPLWV